MEFRCTGVHTNGESEGRVEGKGRREKSGGRE